MDANQQMQLYMIRGVIASLTVDEQAQINASVDKLRVVIKEGGAAAVMALCLVTLEQESPLP